MAKAPGGQGFVEPFLFVVGALGALAGAMAGYGLDGLVQGRRLLALLAAFFSIVVVTIFRAVLGRTSPSLFLAPPGVKIPIPVWISIVFSTLLGGFAGHDLAQLFEVSSGLIIGFISGTLAGICMATLMITYFHEHPERGLEF